MLNTDTKYIQFLYDANETKFGICIFSNDASKLKTKLYTVRAKLRKEGTTEHDNLVFKSSPENPMHEVWVIKK
jgi:hypothetical protein